MAEHVRNLQNLKGLFFHVTYDNFLNSVKFKFASNNQVIQSLRLDKASL